MENDEQYGIGIGYGSDIEEACVGIDFFEGEGCEICGVLLDKNDTWIVHDLRNKEDYVVCAKCAEKKRKN
jgi:hypothetical protein